MSHNQTSEMATESTSGTNILSVNLDCLAAIFSSKFLSIEDFCSIAETHSHLKEAVGGVFAKRHKNYELPLRDKNYEVTFRSRFKFEREKTKRILTNFGAWISELSINASRNYSEKMISECLNRVPENCTNTLKSLELVETKITKARAIKLKPLFDKLQKISLRCGDVYSGKTLFNDCKSLVELKLYNVKFDDPLSALENTFPKLIRFEYEHCKTDFIDDSIWGDFFSHHKNLKAIQLKRIDGTAHLLPMLADNCKQLAELNIDIGIREEKFQKELCSILTLEHLNKLNIECDGQNINKFSQRLATLKSLHVLTLRWVSGDSKLVAALSKLRLQSLELWGCKGITNLNPLGELEGLTQLKIHAFKELDLDLVAMIKSLIRLETLYLSVGSFQMDKRIYQRIVDVLRERPGNLQNTLQISCWTAKDFAADRQFDKILTITDLERKFYF